MRPVRKLVVRPRLPPELEPLRALALNLRWSWDRRAQDVFAEVDPEGWGHGRRDPVRLLDHMSTGRATELAGDAGFLERLRSATDELERSLNDPAPLGRATGELGTVAYFSPEFGIAEAIPQYSGGLGVLAGDHLKAASDLGVPLVAVGLLYQHGYFRQELDVSGWQREHYPMLDPVCMALRPVEDVSVRLPLDRETLAARIWRADVGRVPLFLLDANVPENPPELRLVTDRLYGGGQEHRIRQEILLGMGGVLALREMDINPEVFHTNEGHAGFLILERIRRLVADEELSFPEAVEAVRGGTVFTTHTSVPAGIDRFPRELIERYFAGWAADCGVTVDDLMALGHEPGQPSGEAFNMAVMGLRLAGACNGVSRLHGRVTRRLFADVWPEVPEAEIPIDDITNGVHARSWVSGEVDALLSRSVGEAWPDAPEDAWRAAGEIPAEDLWSTRRDARERLVRLVRHRVREVAVAGGQSDWDLGWCDELLDPDVLTIGFARRFAGYKRATLLLSRPERLKALLYSEDRPVQIIFSGKAHPADDRGKAMIHDIVSFAREENVRRRLVFLEDYDILCARALVQGCDLWLNTPRRPHEACGTSGMKAALNGVLNCSILDGWWDELFNGDNGWAISSAEMEADDARRDAIEAEGLFRLLEERVVPAFYARDDDGIPQEWVGRMRACLRSLGPAVTASRMVREYTERLYEPAAARTVRLREDGYGRARELAAYKERVAAAWSRVRISVDDRGGASVVDVGEEQEVLAIVTAEGLSPEDLQTEILHGPLADDGALHPVGSVPMRRVEAGADGWAYEGRFRAERPGPYGFTVRAVPAHPQLGSSAELGLMAWA